MSPSFLITIDTEGDDLWSQPRHASTRNARFLPRFQALCERYRLKPTYLTNYEMACAPEFVEFARDAIGRGQGEVGMHLHAWHSPPAHELTGDDANTQPYLIEYPEEVMRAKVRAMTDVLEQTFAVKMTSHRAGRWGFDARYARLLLDHGYVVDCSVTPHVSWRSCPGDPSRDGGPDYSAFPEHAYWLDPSDISRPGPRGLLELPVTVRPRARLWHTLAGESEPDGSSQRLRTLRGKLDRVWPSYVWLRPTRRNRREMRWVVAEVLRNGEAYAEFMLHSSELMPGGSPNFRDERDIERLYDDLESLFAFASERFVGRTLTEHYALVAAQ